MRVNEDRIKAFEREIGELKLKGFHRPLPAYNVLGLRSEVVSASAA